VTINTLPTTTGIADSDVWGQDQAGVNKTMDIIRATNVSAVRLLIPWAAVEATKGTLDWSSIDKTVNVARYAGKIVAVEI